MELIEILFATSSNRKTSIVHYSQVIVIHSVSQNSRFLKLFAIFSPMVYLCNLNFFQLYIPTISLRFYQFW